MPTTHYSNEMLGVLDGTKPVQMAKGHVGGRLHCLSATIPFDGQADGDNVVLGKLPKGAVFQYGVINGTATWGASATIAIGYAGATGAFRAAATYTSGNTPGMFGVAAAKAPLAAEKTIIATIATAALPDSANVGYVDIFYTLPDGG